MDKAKEKTDILEIENTPIFLDYYGEHLRFIDGINNEIQNSAPSHYIHYTSINGFYAMLKAFGENSEKYVTLFPSRVQFLNDDKEFMAGVDLLNCEDITEKIRKICCDLKLRDDAYTVSFCGEEDLLSQWKYYGRESGVSLECDFNEQDCGFLWLQSKETNGEDDWDYDTESGGVVNQKPYRVFYGKEKQKAVLNKVIEYINKMDYVSRGNFSGIILNSIIPYCKDFSFCEEQESRLLFYPINHNGSVYSYRTPIKYRMVSNKIIPQFECRVFYLDARERACPIPIKNIMIGPGYNQNMVFNGVINMLEHGNCPRGFIEKKQVNELLKWDTGCDDTANVGVNELRVVNKVKEFFAYGSSKKEELKYVTYRTTCGITVQLSATPFRS